MASRPGKYAAVIGDLPALGIDPARRDAVTQAQEQIKAPRCAHDPGYSINDLTAEELIESIADNVKQLVELKKRQTAGRPYAAEYARAYAECRAIRDTIAEWDGAFSLLVEAYQWLMIDALAAEGLSGLKMESGASISTYQEPTAKVDDPAALLAWVMQDADLRNKLALAWGTLNALTKARLLEGEPEPPGVSVWAKTVVRLTK